MFPPFEFVQPYPLSQFALLAFTVDVTASAVDFAVLAVLWAVAALFLAALPYSERC